MADIRSVKGSVGAASDEYVEQIRQKIGTEFSDRKLSGKKKNEMGKDDFVKLMSAQLKHQDPTSPLKNEEMAAQLAQFSALEQMVNVNSNLEKMAAAQKPQDNVLAASLIGKRIKTDSSQFSLQKGTQPEIKFNLPTAASTLSVALLDSKGETVREYELGSMAQGAQAIRWDGKNGKGLDAVPGEYSYRVSGTDDQGAPMRIETATGGLVNGVVFENGQPMLLVDEKRIALAAVQRIEADIPAAQPKMAPVSPLTGKQNVSGAGEAEQKITQPVKNSLLENLIAEKIRAQVPISPGEMEALDGERVPDPLWNPSNL